MRVNKRILDIAKTATFYQSILTISATILSGVLGLLFYMFVARSLGPANFGIFAVATATLSLLADVGDLGTDTGLIRFIGKYRDNRLIQLKLLKLSLEVKVIVWILVLLVGFLFTPFIANHIFQKPELIDSLRLAFLGVGGGLFLSFSSHALQAFQKYRTWSVILIISNLIRFILILILMFSLSLNLQNTLLIYIIIPFVFFLVGLAFLPKFVTTKGEFTIANEFFKFNRWIFILSLIAALSSRVDIFLTTRLLNLTQVGLYSAANQLTSFMPQLSFAIATVIAPKLARFSNKREAWNYVKKIQLFIFCLALVGLFGIIVAYFIIKNLYGPQFEGSFPPFIVLYISQLVFLISLPMHQSIFYYFAKPQVFVPITLVQLFIMTILAWILIHSMGIMGAAVAVLVGNIFLLVIPTIWVIKEFRKN